MKRCLLDMDGVLTDWVGGVCRLFRVDNPYDNPANHGRSDFPSLIGRAKKDFYPWLGETFWATLGPTKECFEIVDLVESVFGRDAVAILTSPITTPGCAEGKIYWIEKHLPQYARRFLIGPCKEFAASPDAWLVDDTDEQCDKFVAWGGNAAQVARPWNRFHLSSEFAYTDLKLWLKTVG